MQFRQLLLGTCAWWCLPATFAAPIEFNRDIRPLLSDRCFTCHGPDSGKRATQLRLDREESAHGELRGGRHAIVAGKPEQSELYLRVSSEDQGRRMPPAYAGHKKLSVAEIGMLRRWIEEGGKYQPLWSFIPPTKAEPPAVRNESWPRQPIDRFVLARLEKEGVSPSPEASRRALIRRLSLDLTGLPPPASEVEAFAADSSEAAYRELVDRLLASPRYGERMAVRWLEAARYADTNGYQSDGPRDMWRWRDWVIDAFNRNQPFDRFTIDQIAGDLEPHATLDQKLATAFHRNHRTSAEGGIVDEEFRSEYVADRAETTATVWLGLTVGCARCHDHKYDPITQKEFYQLYAFFNNVPEKGFVYNFGNEEPYMKAPRPDEAKRKAELDARVDSIDQRMKALEPKLEKAQSSWEKKLKKQVSPEWTITDGQVYRSALDQGSEDGPAGKAMHFDGKNFVEADGEDTAKFDYRDPFTFAAWVKPEQPEGAILSRAEDYFEGTGHSLHLIGGKVRLHVIFRWTDLGLRVETEKPIDLRQWHHISATYDGKMKAAGVHIYVDGLDQKLNVLFDQLIWPINPKVKFRIGAAGGRRFLGSIGDVRVYDRALSSSEVAVLFNHETLSSLARMKPQARSRSQSDKLHMAFLDLAAPREYRELKPELDAARKARDDFWRTVPTVMVMSERPERRETHILKRGAYDAPGGKVEPGVPAALPPLPADAPRNRLGLARWLVDRQNPLTARVAVNRIWQMLFGAGLVKTSEDFGSQGEPAVYPELLDWLAVDFMDNGWDVKRLIRTIVTSAVYRQSSRVTPELQQKDPDNRLLARGARFRLPAEMIRDQALSFSGLLVEHLGGPSVKPYQPVGLWQELSGGKYEPDSGDGLYRRSLYTYWRRTIAPPNMINFDSPTRESCVVRAARTNTPLQALNLMNDVLYLEAARKLGERAMTAGGTDRQHLEKLFSIALGRGPSTKEAASLEKALAQFESYYRDHPAEAQQFLKQGNAPVSANGAPAAAWAAVSSIVLNMDETITRE